MADEPREYEAGDDDSFELPLVTARRIVQTLLLVVILLLGIYILFPKLVGLGGSLGRIGEADALWIVVAIGFEIAAVATYIALFKAVVGGDALRLTWGETYDVNLAGLAATRIFSAGGAGGIALTYWAVRKAGMRRREVARRMVAFLTLQYVFYPVALIVFGVLLRTGILPGKDSVELTVVPAAVSGLILLAGLLAMLIPPDLGERLSARASRSRGKAVADTVSKVPATVGEGLRLGFRLLFSPSRSALAAIGAVGYWAANIGILWASFKAFGIQVPLAVVVQGFFLGMVGNLFPLAPGGVGAVDAGMIGAFVLFGLPEATVFPAILIYRLIAFWLPIPPGIAAFVHLRSRVSGWEEEGLPIDRRGTSGAEGASPEKAIL